MPLLLQACPLWGRQMATLATTHVNSSHCDASRANVPICRKNFALICVSENDFNEGGMSSPPLSGLTVQRGWIVEGREKVGVVVYSAFSRGRSPPRNFRFRARKSKITAAIWPNPPELEKRTDGGWGTEGALFLRLGRLRVTFYPSKSWLLSASGVPHKQLVEHTVQTGYMVIGYTEYWI